MEMVNLGKSPALTNQIAWGNVSLKSLEITSDNRAVSHQALRVRLEQNLALLIAES
jgi:hypothetical protein